MNCRLSVYNEIVLKIKARENVKMRIIIFGTGKISMRFLSKLKKDIEIAAFLDNDPSKWERRIEQIPVLPPQKALELDYDFIFLLSASHVQMKDQLVEIGIPKEKIYDIFHIEKICVCEQAQYFGTLPNERDGKNILVYSHALTSTGAQNVLFTAIQVLQKNGYRLAVVSGKDGVLRERMMKLGIPVIIMRDSYFVEDDLKKLVSWADRILVNTLWLYYVVEELLCFQKKILWWIHETGFLEHLEEEKFTRIEDSGLVSVYTVSPLVRKKMTEKYKKSFHTKMLLYGLPGSPVTEEWESDSGKMVFAVIGAIGRIKGQDLFIQAVNRLPNQYKNQAEFWIVGGGELEEQDFQAAQKCSCIKTLGEIENQRMKEIYKKIDVVVCCSREDAMPVVVAEGCMNGKLVIVSDAAGIAAFITSGENGLVFPSGNIDQLKERMIWAIEHREDARRIGKASKGIYEGHFTMELFEKHLLRSMED